IFAILLAALALEALLRGLVNGATRGRAVLAIVAAVVILTPLYRERAEYLRLNTEWGRSSLAAFEAEKKDIERLLANLNLLSDLNPGRVHSGKAAAWGKTFKVGSVPVYGLLTLEGFHCTSFLYHSMSIASDTMVLIDESRPEDLSLFGIRYVVAPDKTELAGSLRHYASFGRFDLYEAPYSSYFDIISVPYAFEGDRTTVYEPGHAWLNHPLRRAKQHIALVLGNAPPDQYKRVLRRWEPLPMPEAGDSPPSGMILLEEKRGEKYTALIRTAGPCHILFKSSFHPGLEARVNGRVIETVMVTPGFAAFPVEAGTHEISVCYSSGSLKPVLLFLGIIAAAGLGWASRRGVLSRLENAISGITWETWQRISNEKAPGVVAAGRRHGIYLVLILVLSLIALRPCYRGLLMKGHDATEYPPRLVQYHENIRHGILYPQWAPDLGNGYGQPLFLFLPPLFYSAAEALHLTGAGLANSIQIAALFLGLFAALAMYGIGVSLRSRRAGLVMATAYLFSPYVQTDLYVRGNFMEYTALCMLPLSLLMIIRVAHRPDGWRLPVAALSVALVVLSHNAIALIFLPALLVVGLMVSGLHRRRVTAVISSCVAGMGLSAFFWLPALMEKKYTHIDKLKETFLHYSNHFVEPHQLLYAPWGYGLSVPGDGDGMSFMIGPVHITLAVVGAFIVLRKAGFGSSNGRMVSGLVIASLGSLFMCLEISKPIWDILPMLQYLQFPWRILAIPSLMFSALAGLWLLPEGSAEQAGGRRQGRGLNSSGRWFVLVAMAALILFNFSHAKPSGFHPFDDAYYKPEEIARKGINTTTREEHEPKWIEKRPAYTGRLLESMQPGDSFNVDDLVRRPDRIDGTISAAGPITLRLNVFYYPGWEVMVDGGKAEVEIEKVHGRMLFALPSGSHSLQAHLTPTAPRMAGRWISLLTLFVHFFQLLRWHAQSIAARRR
ncbi:6-pyruvoyl-tetrahydropterin synthase-related protein, partial [Acidobacteriota bacterium]